MAKQVIKLGLEFDTKSAISSYRQLVSEMQKGGADPKAIKQFTAAIEKAETELAQLAAEGSTGFTDSKGIEQYQKKVLKTVTSMQQLALRMQDFSREGKNFPLSEAGKLEQKIKDLKKAVTDLAEEAKKNLQSSLKNMGFSKTQAAEIANAVKTEEELKQRLEQERQLRQKNLDLAREQAQASVDAARGTKASSVESNSTRVKALTSGVDKISGVNPEAIKETVAEAFRSGIRKGVNNANDIVADLKKTFAQQFGEGTEITNALSEMLDKGLEASGDNISGWLNSIALKTGEALNPEKFKDLVAALNQVSVAQTDVVAGQFGAKMEESAQAAKDAATAEGQLGAATTNTNKILQQSEQTAGGLAGTMEQSAQAFLTTSDAQKQTVKSTEQLEGGFNRLADRLKYMFGFTAMFNKLRQIIRSTFNDIQELDKAYASIAYVTNETVGSLWSTYNEYAGMAEKLGQSTSDVIKASAIYRQQGLDTKEALELTTDTMKLATIAGNDYSTATQEMTAALRGFKMEMDEGSHVSDVYSELAAHAAASVDDIAQAMSRTASIANSAGMSFENTSAFLTQMIETTQESAENIGTSMKTIIARFTELKENVAGTADSEFDDLSFNKVDEALKSVGVALKDAHGQFRDLDDVFLELSSKWDTLDRNTQRYIATVAAGSRQQSRFIALMDNYDRTIELIDTAADSEGKADEQFAKAADTIEFKLNAIKTKWEEFKLTIMDSSFVKGLLDSVNKAMDGLKNLKMPQLAIGAAIAIPAVKNFIQAFIRGIQQSAKNFKQIGDIIGKNISSGISSKINKFSSSNPLKKFYTKLAGDVTIYEKANANLTKRNQELTASQQTLAANLDKTDKKLAYYNKQKEANGSLTARQEAEVAKLNQQRQREQNILNQVNAELDGNTAKLKNNNVELEAQQQRMQQIADNTGQAMAESLRTIGYAAMTMIGAIIAGADATTALKTMAIQLGVMAAQQALQAATSAIATTLAEKAKTKAVVEGAAEREAAIAAEQVAETATIAAGGAAQAAAATASGTAIGAGLGGGFTTAFITSTAGIGAIILGITAAIAAITAGLVALVKYASSKNKTLEEQIAEAEAKLEESQKIATQEKSNAKESDKTYENMKKTKEEFDKLSAKQIRTTEEQERYNELVSQIKDEMPEIITYHNEVTGELQVQNELWDSMLEKAKTLAKLDTSKYVAATFQAVNDKIFLEQKRYESSKKDIDTAKSFLTSDYLREMIEPYKEAGYSSKQIYNYLRSNFPVHLDTTIEQLGIDIEDDLELTKFLDSLGDITIQSNSKPTKEQLNNYQTQAKYLQQLTNQTAAIENNMEIAKKQADAEKRSVIKESYKNAYGVSDSVADLVSGAALVDYSQEAKDLILKMLEDNKDYVNNISVENGKVKIADLNTWGNDDNFKSWSELAKITLKGSTVSAQQVLKTMTYNGEAMNAENWEEIRQDDDDWLEFMQDFGDHAQALIAEEKALLLTLTDQEQAAWNAYAEDRLNLTETGLEQQATMLKTLFGEDSEIWKLAEAKINEDKQNLENLKTDIHKWNDQLDLSDMTTSDLTAIKSELQKITDDYGETVAKQFTSGAFDIKKNLGLDAESFSKLLSIDWSKVDLTNMDAMKIQVVDSLTDALGSNKAERAWDQFFALAKDKNLFDFAVTSKSGVESLADSLYEEMDKYSASFGNISNIIKEQLEKGTISYTSSRKLKEELDKLGIDAADFIRTSADGGITLAAERLKKVFIDQGTLKDKAIAQAKESTQLALDEVTNQIDLLKAAQATGQAEEDRLDISQRQVQVLASQVKLMQEMGLIDSALDVDNIATNAKSLYSGIAGKITADGETQLKTLEERQRNLQTAMNQLENGEFTEEVQRNLLAYIKEINNQYEECIPTTDELTKKEEDHKKALEDLAKAQQDVVDKQKALNEAIADYNKLLYGSDNRQSGLDLLYNYKQAISAFSDEMSRVQELMEDATSIDEASTALSRYTSAAHQRLAYMQAEGTRYNEGLEARRNQLLSGATSYTNELTGNTTTINFGDYVKYNADTGLMAIDQKLIQDAKIADEWKDYIEKQVDDYNKLSQESLKNQDEIRKLEKEIQKRREDAIKKYADFEKDIAETLKAQYQEQVDNLKNKYDSMKEADDDYLDALQEAIEKQRKLRERENQWEDLAQKQKKLSLMQRDTSGANAIETQKLEKEIQNDREQLLDESIDSAIENMQKLAETQDELRQTEVELKEALLENTMYWNQQAGGVAAGFETAEDYVEWFKQTAVELNAETGAQFENTMNEARNKFGSASEEIAWRIQDDMSQTGDSVTETITVTGEEIENITKTTSDTFVDEVSNTFERTKQSFNDNMDSAIQKINQAQEAFDEAVKKMNEAAAAANAAAEAERNYRNSQLDTPPPFNSAGIQENTEAIADSMAPYAKDAINNNTTYEQWISSHSDHQEAAKTAYQYGMIDAIKERGGDAHWGSDGSIEVKNISLRDQQDLLKWLQQQGFTQISSYTNSAYPSATYARKFASGGLVNYTGPAWVDGTTERPEAFLSSEDTERIGNAAKLLSDIPALNRSNISTNSSTYGDTNIEINLNIDHISSDVDIEEMLDRVKQEIVDIARPVGTNVILQQQV